MSDEDRPVPIQGHIFGRLTEAEEKALMRRALDDQEVFNELWDAAEERQILQDPACRERLLRCLEPTPQPGLWSRLSEQLAATRVRLVLAAVVCTAAILVLVFWKKSASPDELLGLLTTPQTDLTAYFRIPPSNLAAVDLDLHRAPAVFRPGELIHATIRLRGPGALFVIQRGPGAAPRMIFPQELSSAADVPGTEINFAFDPVPPTTDITAQQKLSLRVIVLPRGYDIRTQRIEWSGLHGEYTAKDFTYDVAP